MIPKHIVRSNIITDKIHKQQAQFLQANGECKGIIDKSDSTEFYYVYKDSAYRVIFETNNPIHVFKISIDEMNRILNCANLEFGD